MEDIAHLAHPEPITILALQNAQTALNVLSRESNHTRLLNFTKEFTYHFALQDLHNRLENIEDVADRMNLAAEIIRRQDVVLVRSVVDDVAVGHVRGVAPVPCSVTIYIDDAVPQNVIPAIEQATQFVNVVITPINPFPKEVRNLI